MQISLDALINSDNSHTLSLSLSLYSMKLTKLSLSHKEYIKFAKYEKKYLFRLVCLLYGIFFLFFSFIFWKNVIYPYKMYILIYTHNEMLFVGYNKILKKVFFFGISYLKLNFKKYFFQILKYFLFIVRQQTSINVCLPKLIIFCKIKIGEMFVRFGRLSAYSCPRNKLNLNI